MGIMQFILQCMYFMLPAYLANMAPVIFRKQFKSLAIPLDFGWSYDGKRILGNNKTVRGLVVGVAVALIVSFIQYMLSNHAVFYYLTLPALDYSKWFILGITLGAGAIIGDAAESFFKRRRGIPPGKPWVPFDQIDFVLGALLFTSIIYLPRWHIIITILMVSFLLHFSINHLAYFLKIRKEKW